MDSIKPAYSRTSAVDFKAFDQNINVGHKYSQKNKLKKRTVNKNILGFSKDSVIFRGFTFHLFFLCETDSFHCL